MESVESVESVGRSARGANKRRVESVGGEAREDEVSGVASGLVDGKVRWEDASLGERPVPREADWSGMRGETAASGEE